MLANTPDTERPRSRSPTIQCMGWRQRVTHRRPAHQDPQQIRTGTYRNQLVRLRSRLTLGGYSNPESPRERA